MKLGNILIDIIEYKEEILYIYYKNYHKEKYFNKILCFKDVKSFTYSQEELAYHDEIYEYLENLKIDFFTRVFYRNKKKRKIYIFDANYSITMIEFNKEKEWKYREQKN